MSSALQSIHEILGTTLLRVGDRAVTGATLLTIVLIILGSFLLSRALRTAIGEVLKRRGLRHEGRWQIIARLIHYSVMAIGTAIAMDNFGINLGALFTAGAVFAVGFGFAMQTIAQNFVSGVILVTEGAIELHSDGIVIAFPQLDLHVVGPANIAAATAA